MRPVKLKFIPHFLSSSSNWGMVPEVFFPCLIAYVRYIRILTWLRGFTNKTAIFSRLHCLAIPGRDLSTKRTKPNREKWPESLGALLEFWYIERRLFLTVRGKAATARQAQFSYFIQSILQTGECITIHMKMSLTCMWIKTYFHWRVGLKKRLLVNQKWSINITIK